MMAKRNPNQKISVVTGDYVLLGGTRASFPSDWILGAVLWTAKGDLLIQRSNQNGNTWLEVAHVSTVRAKGTIAELLRIQETARKAVQSLQQGANECETALGRARDAVWKKLDELEADGLNIFPPDFEAIEADHARVQAAMDQAEAENDQATARIAAETA